MVEYTVRKFMQIEGGKKTVLVVLNWCWVKVDRF